MVKRPVFPQPISDNEPPHPDYWENKFPYPIHWKKERDMLLVEFMKWNMLDPEEFKKRRSRYQYVSGPGFFRCKDLNCLQNNGNVTSWRSQLTWVRFDMYEQTVRVFGQKCRNCEGKTYGGRYCYPKPFFYDEWRKRCLKAIDKAMRGLYVKDDVILEDGDNAESSKMPEDELAEMMEKMDIRLPHKRYLCQRCMERKGPCTFPHKPEDCKRCQNHPRGLCYDPKKYL